jgi:hypothetical protein
MPEDLRPDFWEEVLLFRLHKVVNAGPRQMQRFKSPDHAQAFLSAHGIIYESLPATAFFAQCDWLSAGTE